MATIGTVPTLIDWVKRRDSNGNLAQIVELLNQTNDVIDDIPWMESNDTAAHLVTQRTSLPKGTWRGPNQGIAASKSTTAQILEAMGNLEDYSKVDVLIANQRGDAAAYRRSEDAAFLEGMAQTVVQNWFYGNAATNPRGFTGLSPRYNSLAAENAENIIDCGGTGSDNTSIWLVGYGERAIHGLFPLGQFGGLKARNLGEDTAVDSSGLEFQVYRTHFQWQCGLAVEDWRWAVRAANIDVSDLALAGKAGYVGNDLIDTMISMTYLVPNMTAAKLVFYVNRRIAAALHKLARVDATGTITVEAIGGKPITMFLGIPVKRVDQLLETEARVV